MIDINVGQHAYVIGKLDAFAQFHVSRRIAPVIPTIAPLIQEVAKGNLQDIAKKLELGEVDISEIGDLKPLAEAAIPFADALAAMSDEHANYVINTCLSVVKRKTDSGAAAVCRNGSIMFDDLELGEMLPLVIAVLRSSLGNFISGLATKAIIESQPD